MNHTGSKKVYDNDSEMSEQGIYGYAAGSSWDPKNNPMQNGTWKNPQEPYVNQRSQW